MGDTAGELAGWSWIYRFTVQGVKANEAAVRSDVGGPQASGPGEGST